jgi:hypothetical protein
LLPWTRYAPPMTFIDSGAPLQKALEWSNSAGTDHSVLQRINLAVSGILFHIDKAKGDTQSEVWNAQMSLVWLRSEPVEKWYMSLPRLQQMHFCTLLRHISSRCREIGQHDGYFIALNYAVRGSFPSPCCY